MPRKPQFRRSVSLTAEAYFTARAMARARDVSIPEWIGALVDSHATHDERRIGHLDAEQHRWRVVKICKGETDAE